jgi:hypothetical protein
MLHVVDKLLFYIEQHIAYVCITLCADNINIAPVSIKGQRVVHDLPPSPPLNFLVIFY